jgi:hypothetical protein
MELLILVKNVTMAVRVHYVMLIAHTAGAVTEPRMLRQERNAMTQGKQHCVTATAPLHHAATGP